MTDNYENITFQFYPAKIQIPEPLGTITLKEFIRANKEPKKEIIDLLKKIETASAKNDLTLKAKLKEKLFYFTLAVITDGMGRSYSNITSFNNLLILDFDKIDNAPEFKQFLFDNLNCVIAAYLSPSKKGCKFIIRTEGCNSIKDFKELFSGLAYHMEKYEGFDGSSINCCLPLYISYDPDLLYRSDAKAWTIRGERIDSFKPFVGDIEIMEDVSEEDVNHVKNILRKSLEKITTNGHSVVVSTSVACGGYISAGYLSEEDGVSFLESVMKQIPYLQKSMGTYIKTMRSGVKKGMSSPLYLKEKTN